MPERLEQKPQKSIKEIVEVLQREGFEVLEAPKDEQTPDEVRMEGFDDLSDVGKRALAALPANCRSYLSGAIIRDNYGEDRIGRNAKWSEVAKKYGQEVAAFHDRDKLRGNVMTNIQGYLDWLVLELDRANIHTPQADFVRASYKRFNETLVPEEYVGMSFDEKLRVVEKIDEVVRPLLRLIATGEMRIDTDA
ncbi:MAG: hypothetical protein NUV59_02445 [Patescibacteria group bacterium]|nr:hypothetical protein [Patescibacteria group bacterium]